jgi:hypothetical protein
MKEWEKYKIDGELAETATELDTVRHIAHVPHARRIIEDRKIRAGLVYDESHLKTSRISVTWVSANTWNQGSIYGTVEFQFDWKMLIAGKNVYWVEAIEKYNPPAFRFLITARKYTSEIVTPYDPAKDDGPLRTSGDKWYWNGNFTSEIMIDEDLWLREGNGLDFIDHNPQICRTYRSLHADCKQKPPETGGRILAYILAHNVHDLDAHLKPKGSQRNHLLDMAFLGLRTALAQDLKFGGGPLNFAGSCERAVTGALALYGMDQLARARHLLTLISTVYGFEAALLEVVRQHFSAPEWMPPPF